MLCVKKIAAKEIRASQSKHLPLTIIFTGDALKILKDYS